MNQPQQGQPGYVPMTSHQPFNQPPQPNPYQQQRRAPTFPQQQGVGGFAGMPQPRMQQNQPRPAIQINPYAGIGSARPDANVERDGAYLWRIDSVIRKVKQMSGLPFVVVTKTCLAVLHPGEAGWPHSIGEEVQHFINYSIDFPQYFVDDMNRLISGVTGCHPTQVTEAMANAVESQAQPFAGLVVECRNQFRNPGPRSKSTQPRVQVKYFRRWSAAELPNVLAPEVLAKFFPGDALQRLADIESRVLAAVSGGGAGPQIPAQQPQQAPAQFNASVQQQGPAPMQAPPLPNMAGVQNQPHKRFCGSCGGDKTVPGGHNEGCPEDLPY